MKNYATVAGVEYYANSYGTANTKDMCEYAKKEKKYPTASKPYISFRCVGRMSKSGFMKLANRETPVWYDDYLATVIGSMDIPVRWELLRHSQSSVLVESNILMRSLTGHGDHAWFISRTSEVSGASVTMKYAFKFGHKLD